jgi:predicted Zn-dependent protease with MMP-like domain
MPFHVSQERFDAVVREALDSLPPQIAAHVADIPVIIQHRPTPRQLEEAGLEPDELLLGLYVGQALTERSVSDPAALPPQIFIFKEDCELVSESEDQLRSEIRTTVLHEIGHHFGLDEDDLEELGFG